MFWKQLLYPHPQEEERKGKKGKAKGIMLKRIMNILNIEITIKLLHERLLEPELNIEVNDTHTYINIRDRTDTQ